MEEYEGKGRPLRLAIDISIWLFQIQSGKGLRWNGIKSDLDRLTKTGGTNPALRTFYYRLLRLISLSIHPLFVFDGPNKPPFKRNKRTGPNVASIPEFLAKQLLKQFGLPFHLAPGEAEAECALLQQKGIVDAVLSEDVDTLMFGSGLTLRNWSAEGTLKSKTPTHVNMYDAQKTKASSRLDREGMILVALMSGGDYVPEGIPGCGPKTACEAAKAGFGADLCKLDRRDATGIAQWKQRLEHELETNESKFFRAKHKALVIPEDFPRLDILGYYTHPCVSSSERLERLREEIKWDEDFDIPALRTFVGEAFDWVCIGGARKFVRNLAPALLIKQLRLRAQSASAGSDDTYFIATQERQLVESIFTARTHITTDNTRELRIGFIPLKLVDIDLDKEEPDPEVALDPENSEDETDDVDNIISGSQEPGSPKKKRAPSAYDPAKLEKMWVLETFVKVGVPLMAEDWEETFRNAKKYEAAKAARKKIVRAGKGVVDQLMPRGALDPFTRVTKPGSVPGSKDAASPISLSQPVIPSYIRDEPPRPQFRVPPSAWDDEPVSTSRVVIDIASSPETTPRPRKRTFTKSHSDNSGLATLDVGVEPVILALGHSEADAATVTSIEPEKLLELPPSVTTRRYRSPIRRTQSSNDTPTRTRTTSPARLPDDAFSESDVFKTPTKRGKIPAASAPETPRSIIEITSSPSTPRSGRRAREGWLAGSSSSARRRASHDVIDNDMPLDQAQLPLATGQPPRKPHDTGQTDVSVPFLDCTSEDLLPALVETGVNWVKASRTGTRPLAGRIKVMDVVRLRDSLDGAWALGDSQSQKDGLVGSGKKRGRSAREWRMSQVEILDLSGGG